MSTVLLFLLGSMAAGIFLRNKPGWVRFVLAAVISVYMCYAYLLGGAQF